jgi:hypothetical protein
MRINLAVVVSLLVGFLLSCGGSAQVKAHSPAQARAEVIASKFLAGEIDRIEIVHIPPRILTRTSVTPEMIEKSFHYKLTITAPAFGAYKETLNQSLHSTSVKPEAEMKDIRWGAIFYSHQSRIGALYFDASGNYGSVDAAPVSFKDKQFFDWLNASFSGCFR